MNIINPNNKNISGANSKTVSKKQVKPVAKIEYEDLTPPQSQGFRFVPDEFELGNLIKRALKAMQKGVNWDRGSIVNIEV